MKVVMPARTSTASVVPSSPKANRVASPSAAGVTVGAGVIAASVAADPASRGWTLAASRPAKLLEVDGTLLHERVAALHRFLRLIVEVERGVGELRHARSRLGVDVER